MAGIFKIKYAPDGVLLTDANCYYCSSDLGFANNQGTILSPFDSPIVLLDKPNKPYVVVRGKFSGVMKLYNRTIIADGYAEFLDISNFDGSIVYGCTLFKATTNTGSGISLVNCKINMLDNVSYLFRGYIKGCVIQSYKSAVGSDSNNEFSNNTVFEYINNIYSNNLNSVINYIVVGYVELFNQRALANTSFIPIFKNCVFLKSVLYKWNGTVIPIAYGSDPANHLNDLLASLTAFANTLQNATEKAYLQSIIACTFENTCQIVDDSTQRVFNRYYNGIPIDFTLKTSNNPALTASSSGSFVGAYKGGVQLPPPEIKDINPATLAETANVPSFVVKKPNGAITAVLGATQRLNAVKFTDVAVPKEMMLSGSVSDFKSGLGGSIMTVGIIQPLSINTLPQEGFAVVPKDAPGVVSQTLPKLTMKFNGETELFYKASTGLPLTFNDLAGLGVATDKNLALYGTWGVTTADYESYLLAGINTVVAKKIKIKYCDILIYIYNAAE